MCVCVGGDVSCLSRQRVNDRLEKSHVTERVRAMETGEGVNWATAEALAVGTLLYQGGEVAGME